MIRNAEQAERPRAIPQAEPARERLRAIWSAGDYAEVARKIIPGLGAASSSRPRRAAR